MKQTKIESGIEALFSVAIGFCISLLFWSVVIVPVFHLKVQFVENLQITALFTIISIIRSYLVRRFFNAGLHRAAHKLAVSIIKKGEVNE